MHSLESRKVAILIRGLACVGIYLCVHRKQLLLFLSNWPKTLVLGHFYLPEYVCVL